MKSTYLKAHHVEPVQITEQSFEMTIIGRNSNGTKQSVRIEMDSDLFLWFVKERIKKAVVSHVSKVMSTAVSKTRVWLDIFGSEWSNPLARQPELHGETKIMTYDPKDFR